MKWFLASCVLVVTLLFGSAASGQTSSVVNTKHNLSISGPGPIHATTEQEVCIFCHTPHNATPVQPLWNRSLPTQAYIPYTSNSLQAKPGQPTGASKLCLSCHDGTIALGLIGTRNQTVQMAGGMTTLPPGHSANLGTDLSDDHPISFKYDQNLIGLNPKLTNPAALSPALRLDGNSELQCTTCHDAHDNTFGKFLVMDNSNSQLCNSCHRQGVTTVVNHSQCASCHKPHTAPSGPYLLAGTTVTNTCLTCHSGATGTTQGANVFADLQKFSRHDTNSPVNLKNHIPNNTVCDDCHESHTMAADASAPAAPLISGKLGRVSGVNSTGAKIPAASNEYEVCFKCHADQQATQGGLISRKIVQHNTRLQFAPDAASFHPVQTAGRNTDVPSLRQGMTTASVIYCTDCHNSDTSKAAGGNGPNGPHGSSFAPLLMARYDTADQTPESSVAYALCYKCHDRASILSDQSFASHNKHIVTQNTPCSICHDSHGVSSTQGNTTNNAHLINFDVAAVQEDPVTHRLEYSSQGPRHGTCYLQCHGKAHSPLSY